MADPTPVDLVRLLIADVNTDTSKRLLTDPQITNYLAIEGDNVKLAAAQALDTIASSEALVSKAITTQDLTTDGPKLADALRRHAAALRAQVSAAIDAEDDGFFFGSVYPVDPSAGGGPELTERWL